MFRSSTEAQAGTIQQHEDILAKVEEGRRLLHAKLTKMKNEGNNDPDQLKNIAEQIDKFEQKELDALIELPLFGEVAREFARARMGIVYKASLVPHAEIVARAIHAARKAGKKHMQSGVWAAMDAHSQAEDVLIREMQEKGLLEEIVAETRKRYKDLQKVRWEEGTGMKDVTKIDQRSPSELEAEKDINTYYRARHLLEDLRDQASHVTEPTLRAQLDARIASGEPVINALRARLMTREAEELRKNARLEHDLVVEELWRAMKRSDVVEEIPTENVNEVREKKNEYHAFLVKLVGRVLRVGGAGLGYWAGATLATGGLGTAAIALGTLTGHALGTGASRAYAWWNERRHRVDYARTIFQRMTTQGRGERSSYERFHRVLLHVAEDARSNEAEKQRQILRQYKRLDPRFNYTRDYFTDLAVMGGASGIIGLLRYAL